MQSSQITEMCTELTSSNANIEPNWSQFRSLYFVCLTKELKKNWTGKVKVSSTGVHSS